MAQKETQIPRLHQSPPSGSRPWQPAPAEPLARTAAPALAGEAPEPEARRERDAAKKASVPPARAGRHLPLGVRVLFWVVGGVLFLLGVAGLVLPGLQGILFLLLAAAVLSIASHTIYFWLRGLLAGRFPKLWRRLERFRTGLRWKLRRRRQEPSGTSETSD